MFNCWQEDPADRPTFQDLRRELKRMENQHKVGKSFLSHFFMNRVLGTTVQQL